MTEFTIAFSDLETGTDETATIVAESFEQALYLLKWVNPKTEIQSVVNGDVIVSKPPVGGVGRSTGLSVSIGTDTLI